jgi:hypothetical protein
VKRPEPPSEELRRLVEEPLPADEFARRLAVPLTDEEVEDTIALHRWFVRRYPTALERLAYVRRKYREWTRPLPVTRP